LLEHDLVAPFGRHVLLPGRAGVGHHGVDFAIKALRIELECFFTLAIEENIGIQLHRGLLEVSLARGSCFIKPFSYRKAKAFRLQAAMRLMVAIHESNKACPDRQFDV
jgi:hypothetical protein